jgi:hypothetical protein
MSTSALIRPKAPLDGRLMQKASALPVLHFDAHDCVGTARELRAFGQRFHLFFQFVQHVKKHIFRSLCIATSVAAVIFGAAPTFAQTPARSDKIMTISELRTCMKMKQANDAAAAEILQTQQSFARDKDALKTEQADVKKASDEFRVRGAALRSERDEISNRVTELNALGAAAKTDEQKAAYETERKKLVERNRVYEQNAATFTVDQKVIIERVDALNARVDAFNKRNDTINDQVGPQQDRVIEWRTQCGNRRFREEDEVVIKKELAAGK